LTTALRCGILQDY